MPATSTRHPRGPFADMSACLGACLALCPLSPISSPALRTSHTPAPTRSFTVSSSAPAPATNSGSEIPSILSDKDQKWFENSANMAKWEAWWQDAKAVKAWEASLNK